MSRDTASRLSDSDAYRILAAALRHYYPVVYTPYCADG